MNRSGLTKHLLIYEIRNTVGNIFVIFFGVFFPLLISLLFSNVFAGQAPESARREIGTSIFLSMIMIIPMATMFIGYAATYSQELENNIPLRLDLFGVSKRSVLAAKLLANLLFLIMAMAIYFAVDIPLIKMYTPTAGAVLLLIAAVILVGGILLVISHSIANLLGKFGPTYAVTMILYFGFMVLCGMMGIQVSQFPRAVQGIAKLLPMTYMGTDFIKIWRGESYDPTYFILSFVSLAVVAVVLFLISLWKNRHRK
jgi:ABC-2 type transport system permease protein